MTLIYFIISSPCLNSRLLWKNAEAVLEAGCSKQHTHVGTHTNVACTHSHSHAQKTGVTVVIIVKSISDRLILSFHPSSALSGKLLSTATQLCKILHNRFFFSAKHYLVCSKLNTLSNFSLGTATTKGLSFLRYVKAWKSTNWWVYNSDLTEAAVACSL